MYDEVIGGWWLEYLNSGGLGQDYTFYPLEQAQANPYAFESVIINDGSEPQDVTMYVDVLDAANNIVFSTNSLSQSLSPSSRDTFICSSFFTPLTGFYEVRMWSVADSAGAGTVMTYSDTAVKMSEVTDYVYGKDLNVPNGSWQLSRSTGGFEVSSNYDMYADATLYSIDAHISDYSVVGSIVYAILYEDDLEPTSDPIPLAQSDDYTITSADLGAWINIDFLSPQMLMSGTGYRIAIGSYIHPTDSVGVDMSGTGDYSSQGLFDKDDHYQNTTNPGQPTWYTIADIPMLRMNFDPGSTTALSDVKQTVFNTFPNPTNGIFTIKLESNSNYDITVNNVLGQTVILTTTNGMNTTIDLSSFDKGVYTVELKNNNSIYVEKVIVE